MIKNKYPSIICVYCLNKINNNSNIYMFKDMCFCSKECRYYIMEKNNFYN